MVSRPLGGQGEVALRVVAMNSEFSHARSQCAGIDIEDGRSPIFSFNAPVRLLEHGRDMVTFQVRKSLQGRIFDVVDLQRRFETVKNPQ